MGFAVSSVRTTATSLTPLIHHSPDDRARGEVQPRVRDRGGAARRQPRVRELQRRRRTASGGGPARACRRGHRNRRWRSPADRRGRDRDRDRRRSRRARRARATARRPEQTAYRRRAAGEARAVRRTRSRSARGAVVRVGRSLAAVETRALNVQISARRPRAAPATWPAGRAGKRSTCPRGRRDRRPCRPDQAECGAERCAGGRGGVRSIVEIPVSVGSKWV